MRHILDTLIETLTRGETAVMVTIVRNSGSAPRTSGARMLVQADGSLTGTIGGGSIEGECQEKALELFNQSCSFSEIHFSLSSSTMASEGMVCGGTVSVLLHRVEPDLLDTMLHIRNAYQNGERPIVLTEMPSKLMPPRLICLGEDNTLINEDLRKQILKITRRAPFLIKSNEQEFFVDPLVSPGVVHLVGAGHVALATAQLASFADFEVVVMDDREEFASVERYPQANKVIVLDSFDDCLKHLSHTDFVVIVTRGHIHDRDVLAQALHTKAGYIGMIGSRRKREVVYQSLRENGFTEVDLGRVSSPIGLAIGADTPNEIALSIVAELVKVRSEM